MSEFNYPMWIEVVFWSIPLLIYMWILGMWANAKDNQPEEEKEEMKTLLVAITTPFLLGNSAGALGALVPLLIGAAIGLAVIIGIVWGLIKWLT